MRIVPFENIVGSQTSRVAGYVPPAFINVNPSRTAAVASPQNIGTNPPRTAQFGNPVVVFPPLPTPAPPTTTRVFVLQVFRNGNWVDIPVSNAQASIGNGQAGNMTVTIPNNVNDPYRSRLYTGEKIRAFRGPSSEVNRCWTGYVDAPSGNDQGEVIRTVVCTDYIQELNVSILLEGVVYDGYAPNDAAADIINRAQKTGQFNPTDDFGSPIAFPLASYTIPTGNSLAYFPDLINPDGSRFRLASGTSGSFTLLGTQFNSQEGQFTAPASTSGAPYLAFVSPQQYLIAGTVSFTAPFSLASSSSALPPPQGQILVDYFNGIFYMNTADANKTVSFVGNYWSSPLWAFDPGTTAGDAISQIFDKSGFRWHVTSLGKFYSIYVDFNKAISRVFTPGEYISHGIQENRDRRNVIICEGFNVTVQAGVNNQPVNNGQLVVSKAVNIPDITLPPPKGLGKKQYAVFQDPTWLDQTTVDNAAYFAAIHIGRQGKVSQMMIVDDSTINLEDIYGFAGAPNCDDGDLFYIEQITWNYQMKAGSITSQSQITGTSQPGNGWIFVGPPLQTGNFGSYDFTTEVHPVVASVGYLTPTGGTYHSQASRSQGVTLTYEPLVNGTETIELFGSDQSYLGPFVTQRTATNPSSLLTVHLDLSLANTNVFYILKLTYYDPVSKSKGVYRDYIYLTV